MKIVGMLRRGGVRKRRRKMRKQITKKMMNQSTISLISYLQSCYTSTRLAARLSGGSRN